MRTQLKPQRLDLSYRIAWKGRWHVGSGYRSAAANRLQQRTDGENSAPFIPGSQMKGVLRYQCERLTMALGLDAVDPHAGTGDGDRSLVKHFMPLAKSELPVDRLFGSRYQGGCLFVTNAVPVSSEGDDATAVQARTAIDRATGTVMEQHLFTTEVVDGDIDLEGRIRARHPAGILTQENGTGFPCEYALLVAGLLSLDALGGDKSAGLGRCEVVIVPDSLRWNGHSIAVENSLESLEEEDWDVMLDLLREEPGQ